MGIIEEVGNVECLVCGVAYYGRGEVVETNHVSHLTSGRTLHWNNKVLKCHENAYTGTLKRELFH